MTPDLPGPPLDRPIRVLHLIAELGGGGSERWLRDVVALSPGGLHHRVVTVEPDAGGDPVYSEELERLAAYRPTHLPWALQAGVRYLRRHRPTGPNGLRALARGVVLAAALPRVMATARQFRPDVVHSHTIPDLTIGVAVSRAFRAPLLHTVPCLFSQLIDSGHRWTPRLYSLLHPSIACFSAGEGWQELVEVNVPAEKIHYDLGGVDFESVDAVCADRQRHAADVRRDLGLPAGCPIALSVGRFHRSKGHRLALDGLPALLRLVPDLRWVVLGDGEQRGALEERAAQLGVGTSIRFVGYQPQPSRFYAAADVYLRSALYEPENFSFYEAMAVGLPIVGFTTGESRDLILTVGNGIQVPKGDVAAFAEAAAWLVRLPDRGRALGALGAGYARQHLDVRSSVARLSSIYLQLARDGSFDPP